MGHYQYCFSNLSKDGSSQRNPVESKFTALLTLADLN